MMGAIENMEIYNNGHSWRVSFSLGRRTQVLTINDAKELYEALGNAIASAEAASQPIEYKDIDHADFLPWQAHVGEITPDLNMEMMEKHQKRNRIEI